MASSPLSDQVGDLVADPVYAARVKSESTQARWEAAASSAVSKEALNQTRWVLGRNGVSIGLFNVACRPEVPNNKSNPARINLVPPTSFRRG